MTQAVKGVNAYGFSELKLNRIEIHTATNHLKSQAIDERLNVKKEGILCEAGKIRDRYDDHTIYSLLKKD